MSWSVFGQVNPRTFREELDEQVKTNIKDEAQQAQYEKACEAVDVLLQQMTTEKVNLSLSGHAKSGDSDSNSVYVSVSEIRE